MIDELFYESVDLLDEVNILLDESTFASKLTIQSKVKSYNKKRGIKINNTSDLIKNHGNPGLNDYINNSKDIEELNYIKRDTRTVFKTLETIKERIKLCKQLGESQKTKNYYKGIKRLYLDKGITERDVQQTIDNLNKTINLINEKIKKLKKII